MARIPEIVDRLIKWQEWYFSSMSCGVKSPSLHVRVDRSPRIGGLIDFNESEALQTDRAVASLPIDLRKVVTTVYLDPEGRTMDDNARMLHMSRMTLYRKLELADKFIYESLITKQELRDCYETVQQ